jgi:nucleotide-binding universal stress UspA family protein
MAAYPTAALVLPSIGSQKSPHGDFRLMYSRILVPVDGSKTARRALDEAIRLAKIHGSQLRLLHVVNELIVDVTYSPGWCLDKIIESLRSVGQAILDSALATAESAGVKADSSLLESIGNLAADFILAQATEWKADLIVMGTHGRRGLLRLALGSNADLVVRGAAMPVMLIRGKSRISSDPTEGIRTEAIV